ncbi:hypothetical protein BGX38DRAFT_1278252 [Terfezia claveryi]|nr:hypothetical protein BGX38DRAFT_1278252 [Terfezia claveryi]
MPRWILHALQEKFTLTMVCPHTEFQSASSPPPLSAGRERLHTHTASGMSNAPSNRFSLDSEDHNTHQEDGLTAKQSTQLAWQRIPDGMRRLAHAEEDEDHSLDDEHQTSDDEQTENDLDIDE